MNCDDLFKKDQTLEPGPRWTSVETAMPTVAEGGAEAMRAATVFESMRNEAQQAKQEAADLHVENVRLKAQLAALQWRRITAQDLPKEGPYEIGSWFGTTVVFEVAHCVGTAPCLALLRYGWTHFRAINAPPADKAGA
jgi:hypothetical protein